MDGENTRIFTNVKSEYLADLIKQIKSGDTNAFEEFFILMQPCIYRFLFRYLSDKVVAEDLSQDTFVKFWTHKEHLDPSFSSQAYLYKIARNLALNYMNRNHFVRNSQLSKQDKISMYLNPNEDYDTNFLIDEFQKAINHLPERCRAIFILCKYEGFEYSEVAEILGISLQTVKNQMNKAISMLKKLLSSHLI